MAQINTNGWVKSILVAIAPTLGTIATIGFFAGQYLTEFKAQGNKLDKVDKNLTDLTGQVDTIKARQVQNQFNNQLQFQAIWNAIEKRQASVRQRGSSAGTVVQRYVNGQLTYVSR